MRRDSKHDGIHQASQREREREANQQPGCGVPATLAQYALRDSVGTGAKCETNAELTLLLAHAIRHHPVHANDAEHETEGSKHRRPHT